MLKKRLVSSMLAGVLAVVMLTACGSAVNGENTDNGTGITEEKKVLRVGMECAYAPFNWTQESAEVSDGSKAVPIYGTGYYAYGYDVMVAQMIADELGMELEIHKVEWDSIGIGLDANEYDCIIAGMGRTAVREQSYAFTEPYYYRDNCITVKAGSDLEDITGLSQLAGKNVITTTQTSTGWVALLPQIPDAQLGANYATTAECFMAISTGVADVALIDVPTAKSAAMTNDDLVILSFDEDDTFVNDEEMTNVCIATRKDDTELRDTLQGALDSLGWNDKAKMDELMDKAIELQPSAN